MAADVKGLSPDERELRRVVGRLYESVSAPAGVPPPIAADRALLHPLARLCRTVRDARGDVAFQVFSVDEYAEDVRKRVTDMGFFEVEVAHEAFVFGNIAHVLSHYEGYADRERTRRVKKGVNSIQLLRTDDGWKPFSILWDDEENRLESAMS